jgi:hypothetical protein
VTVEGNMMAEQSLEDILSGEEPTVEEEVVEEVETEAETEVETEAEAEETTEAVTTTAESDNKEPEKEPWTKSAYMSEKKKRQELERKLEEVEKKPLPDAIDDPDGFASALREEVATTAFGIKTELSQDLMRELHDDYDEKEAAFMELAQDNPALIQELREASNPARFAYETATKHAELQQLKDIDTYKANLRKEVEAQLREEILGEKATKEAKSAEKEEALKPSLVDAGESVSESEIEEAFDDILGTDANHRKR